jgi:nucleoside-diphosphate-sugar epimerase
MRFLFIGGTGLISTACVELALAQGHEVWMLNRGLTSPLPVPDGVRRLTADARDPAALAGAVRGLSFDSVVQWIGFTPEQIVPDLEVFGSRGLDVGQYVYISSASAYQKPPGHYLVTEETPLENPFWQYSRDKIASERLLLEAHDATGFPVTVVRPSFTYGLTQIPVSVNSWQRPYTLIARMRRGAPILVPGDGTSLWTLTHNRDFAVGLIGLLGNPAAIGQAVHITSDEVLTWNQIYAAVAAAAGVELRALHVPSDALIAAHPDEYEGGLWGDKAHSIVFDNAKIRSLVPGFAPSIPFAEGIKDVVAWFDGHPEHQAIDAEADALWDRVAAVYTEALRQVASAVEA